MPGPVQVIRVPRTMVTEDDPCHTRPSRWDDNGRRRLTRGRPPPSEAGSPVSRPSSSCPQGCGRFDTGVTVLGRVTPSGQDVRGGSRRDTWVSWLRGEGGQTGVGVRVYLLAPRLPRHRVRVLVRTPGTPTSRCGEDRGLSPWKSCTLGPGSISESDGCLVWSQVHQSLPEGAWSVLTHRPGHATRESQSDALGEKGCRVGVTVEPGRLVHGGGARPRVWSSETFRDPLRVWSSETSRGLSRGRSETSRGPPRGQSRCERVGILQLRQRGHKGTRGWGGRFSGSSCPPSSAPQGGWTGSPTATSRTTS